MSSAAQILINETLANQANAQHSRGPTSEEGKARVAENRTTHGLAGSEFCLLSLECPDQFPEFAATTRADYNPQTPEEFLRHSGRLRRRHPRFSRRNNAKTSRVRV